MLLSNNTFMLGPLRCRWLRHMHGQSATSTVRAWLAAELGCAADAVPLERSARGRPSLSAPFQHVDVSWSHSGDGLLIAWAQDIVLGVDVERVRPRPRALELAQRYFTAAETAWLEKREGYEREEAFIRLWCAKEAVLKAHGYGLAFGLDRLAFADTAAGLSMTDCDAALGAAAGWSLIEFVPASGYRAALAWRARPA